MGIYPKAFFEIMQGATSELASRFGEYQDPSSELLNATTDARQEKSEPEGRNINPGGDSA